MTKKAKKANVVQMTQFSQTDWYGWAGAEQFNKWFNGSRDPYIAYVTFSSGDDGACIVADSNGVDIEVAWSDNDADSYSIELRDNPAAAVAIGTALANALNGLDIVSNRQLSAWFAVNGWEVRRG